MVTVAESGSCGSRKDTSQRPAQAEIRFVLNLRIFALPLCVYYTQHLLLIRCLSFKQPVTGVETALLRCARNLCCNSVTFCMVGRSCCLTNMVNRGEHGNTRVFVFFPVFRSLYVPLPCSPRFINTITRPVNFIFFCISYIFTIYLHVKNVM